MRKGAGSVCCLPVRRRTFLYPTLDPDLLQTLRGYCYCHFKVRSTPGCIRSCMSSKFLMKPPRSIPYRRTSGQGMVDFIRLQLAARAVREPTAFSLSWRTKLAHTQLQQFVFDHVLLMQLDRRTTARAAAGHAQPIARATGDPKFPGAQSSSQSIPGISKGGRII